MVKFLAADGIAVGTEQVFTDLLLVGFAGLGGILLRNEDEPQVGIVLKLAAQVTTFFYGLLAWAAPHRPEVYQHDPTYTSGCRFVVTLPMH